MRMDKHRTVSLDSLFHCPDSEDKQMALETCPVGKRQQP